MNRASAVLWALTLVGAGAPATPVAAQDSIAARHGFSADAARLQPFARTYDMVVRSGDSIAVIGERTVRGDTTHYAGAAAWRLVDTRTGAVPMAETLFVAPDLRPLHWSGSMGPARLATEFVGDSLVGAMTAGAWKQNIVLPVHGGAIVNAAMLDALLPLVPLSDTWTDSVAVISLTLANAAVTPGRLAVVASVDQPLDSSGVEHAWIVALSTPDEAVVYWVDRDTGIPARMEQAVPSHVGWRVEFRLRRSELARPSR